MAFRKPFQSAFRSPTGIPTGAGLQYRPLSPGRAALGGGLSGLGGLLMALGSGNPQQAGAAFQGGLQGFDENQWRQRQQAQQDELFGFQRHEYQAGIADKTKAEQDAAMKKAASDAAIDALVQAGRMDPATGQALKAMEIAPSYGDLVPKPQGASSGIGKIMEDLRTGLIDQATADALIRKETYIPPQQDAGLTERQRNALAAGLVPGTPEYTNYLLGNESEGGPFQGKALDAQAMNILLTGDPSKPEYAAAYAHMAAPHTEMQPDGTIQTVTPDVSWAKKPLGQAASAAPEGAQITQVPGATVTTLPGSGVTPQDRLKLRSVEAEAAAIKDALNRFKEVVKETGGLGRASALGGGLSESGRKLNSAWTNAAIMTKAEALFNLGVLNGPDLSVIQGTLPNPATVQGALASDDAYKAAIDEVLRLIDSKVASFQTQYGGTPYTQPGGQPSNIPPPLPGFQVVP